MRIHKLRLIAFGPFTDASLDFSSGSHGLHIVYGSNEAGKSSSLRAISDLLYGMHQRTPDNFVHPYPKLRIGAQLKHSDGSLLDFVRRKANQNALRCGDDRSPIADANLARFIGDVDRELFHTLFGIDHARLRRGGEDISRAGGRIGELLFAAGAGLTGLQAVQADLTKESNDLLTASGRAGTVQATIKEFQAAREAVGKAQVTVETWRQHDEALRAAQEQKAKIDTAIRDKRSEQNRLARIGNAVTSIALWYRASKDLAELGEVPLLAEDFSETSSSFLIELRQAEQRKKDCTASLDELDEKLKSLVLPDALLAEADAVEALRDRLGGYRKALSEQPALETACALAEREGKEILRRLGRPDNMTDIESLRVPADQIVRIQTLGNKREGITERLQSTRRDRDRIQRNIREAEAKLEKIQLANGTSSIRATVIAIQKEGDLESQLDLASTELQEKEADANVQVSQLGLWSGSLEDAECLAVPSLSSIEEFDAEFKQQTADLAAIEKQLREERDSLQHTRLQLSELEREEAVPSVAELETSRELREQGWQLILEAWRGRGQNAELIAEFLERFPSSGNLREAFESSVHTADQIADQLRVDADRVASKCKLQAEMERSEVNGSRFEGEQRRVESLLENTRVRWEELWKPLGIAPLSPLEMRDWLRQQQDISKASKEIRSKRLLKEKIEQRITHSFGEITSALSQVLPEFQRGDRSLRDVLRLASSTCDNIQKAEAVRESIVNSLEESRNELVDAGELFREAELDLETWQSDWAIAMKQLGLEEDAIPAQANSVLSDTASLFHKFREADEARTELDGFRRETEGFEADVRTIVGGVAAEISGRPVVEAVNLLSAKLQDAWVKEDAKSSFEEQRATESSRLKTACDAITSASVSLDEMCRQAECAAYEQLQKAFNQSQRRRELEKNVTELETQLISQSGGASLEAFIAEAEREAADVDSLQPRIDELSREIERLETENEEHIREIEREESELQKIDGSSVAAEKALECESIAARLEDQVRELAVIRLSSAVLHTGIEQYRKKNQAPILSRASQIFSKITLGSFNELRAEFNENGEPVLAAIRCENDTAITVGQMSDGTLDQLYLALRIAVLEGWLDRHEPLPFIIDDVLTNFDDERAIAALGVFAELSRKTQVIFFTHHMHLVETASKNLPTDELFLTKLTEQST